MLTYSIRKRARKSDRGTRRLFYLCAVSLLGGIALAQIYLPKSPPDPSEYGKVVLGNQSGAGLRPVVFDHWLHRSKFTCRVCHVDIGFAMAANATGITATSNREGFHCGACHDGNRLFEGKPIFAACSDVASDKRCDRCHSLGKKGVRQYEYKDFTARLPKGIYGVNWEAAEKSGAIRPLDYIEGLSTKKQPMPSREDFAVKPNYSWVHPILFSHEKHSTWNGCELCHPDIFPPAKKGTVRYSMFSNIEGRYCGACHGRVAFPLNNCQHCHANGPLWAP